MLEISLNSIRFNLNGIILEWVKSEIGGFGGVLQTEMAELFWDERLSDG